MGEPGAVPLVRALRRVRDELRDLSSHPLVSDLVDELARGDVDADHTGRLWSLAQRVNVEFAYCEPCSALAGLDQLLERNAGAGLHDDDPTTD